MSSSNYLEDKILNWITGTAFGTAPTTLYFSLHSADPTDTGANEVTATYVSGRASYTSSNFDTPATVGAARQIKNTAIVDFGNSIAAGTIYYLGVWDAATSGNFLFGFNLVDSIGATQTFSFGNGDPVTLAINAVKINYPINNFSIYFANFILNWFKGTSAPTAPTNVYVGLFTFLTVDGTGTEVTTTIRAAGRVAVSSWASLTNDGVKRLLKTASVVDFGDSAGAVTGVYINGFYDASTSGNLLFLGTFTPRDVVVGQPVNYPAGSIKIKVA
jgi:hypothetical protein